MPRNTKKVKSNDSKRVTKKKQPIEKIADIQPMEVSERNLLVDAALNEIATTLEERAKQAEQKEKEDKKLNRCPKGHRRNKTTGECEPIEKKPRKLVEGCNYEYKITTPVEIARGVELKKMSIKELRSKLIGMLGIDDPKTESVLGARLKPQFINWIVCLETKRGLLKGEQEKKYEEDDEEDDEEEKEKDDEEEKDEEDEEEDEEEEKDEDEEDEDDEEKDEEDEEEEDDEEIFEDDVDISEMDNVELNDTEKELLSKLELLPGENDTNDYNKINKQNERTLYENPLINDDYNFLYPSLNDADFNAKIASRKEFNSIRYDGTIKNIKEQADKMCDQEFSLMPHQMFVKNFLSFQTPYNALLLYHGLGTGKTCSAIGVAEEMRNYMKQIGLEQKIYIVASPNVQNNFRMQLFDERKLMKIGDQWNLQTCIGNELLKEINPTSMKNIPKEKIVSQMNTLINEHYRFIGYGELGNYIQRKINFLQDDSESAQQKRIQKIQKYFNNHLFIVDEFHNIRISDDNKEKKKTATLLMDVIKHADNIRLLLLSGTPMYNSHKEIIWTTNLLNMVDKRSTIKESEVFDSQGNFVEGSEDKEGGKELLQRKLTGYVSYVRGENPYTFPYRIYPNQFEAENTLLEREYPTYQLNGKEIEEKIENLPIYINKMDAYQEKGYLAILQHLKQKTTSNNDENSFPDFDNMEKFGYTFLQPLLESLNIVYPNEDLEELSLENNSIIPENLIKSYIGKNGLSEIMDHQSFQKEYMLRYNFDYKPDVLENYGRVFHPDNLHKYSHKISNIANKIKQSTGMSIVYSHYIDGGVVPMALALEEMGFTRYGSAPYTKPLLATSTPPIQPIDSQQMVPKESFDDSNGQTFQQAKYVMITGDKYFSPNNLDDLKYVTNENNKNGELVKVVLITRAAAEGLDFKNIRQVHLMEPWYNMNRTEQITGRGVRNLSHCKLPFEERNVEIYYHTTDAVQENEAADMYVYRFAEKKAKKIGEITRILKEQSVDCLLNIGQSNFTVDKLLAITENKDVEINISSGHTIEFQIGDKPFSNVCDYMDNCEYTCSRGIDIDNTNIIDSTYNDSFIKINYNEIIKRIRELFKEDYFYTRETLFNSVNIRKKYPDEEIDFALTRFIQNKHDYLIDKHGRRGYLINKENVYAFQPVEMNDENVSIYERSVPINYKRDAMKVEFPSRQPSKVQMIIEDELDQVETFHGILNKVIANVKSAFAMKNALLTQGSHDWYKHVGNVMNLLMKNHDISESEIREYLVYHSLDTMQLKDKLVLVQSFYGKNKPESKEEDDETMGYIEQYFEERIISSDNDDVGILLFRTFGDSSTYIVYQQDKLNTMLWNQVEDDDLEDYKTSIISKFIKPKSSYNKMVGFMFLSKNDNIDFKMKDFSEKKNIVGIFCESKGKADIIKRINSILPSRVYTDKNIAQTIEIEEIKNSKKIVKSKPNGVFKTGLCAITEILLRHMDKHKKDNKKWFFSKEEAIINNLIGIKSK